MDYPHKDFKIVTSYGGNDYTFINNQFLGGKIIRNENGFDTATVTCYDYKSLNFMSKVGVGSPILIYFKDKNEVAWTLELKGIVRFVETPLNQTETLVLKCDGAGYGLEETVCGEEYGTQSIHSGLDTIREILIDVTDGIVARWCYYILGGAAVSGYVYDLTVEDIAGTINYVYFPYKPCSKCVNDVCDIVQAIKGAAAGPHWIVLPQDVGNNDFVLTTLGTHHAAAAALGWTTYYKGSQAASTLVQGRDFTDFVYQELTREANYILYHGAFLKPPNEMWTEGTTCDTTYWTAGGNWTVADDQTYVSVGSDSIKVTVPQLGSGTLRVPQNDKAWEISKWGGQYNLPYISLMVQHRGGPGACTIRLCTTATKYFYTQIPVAAMNQWEHHIFPIGPYHHNVLKDDDDWQGWMATAAPNAPDWADIDYIYFDIAANASDDGYWYFDNLHFGGQILRGAYEAGIGAANPLKVKVITDNVAKDDSGKASDDTGLIGRLAYAELLRCKTTPVVGHFSTALLKDLLPGQLVHTHAKRKMDGTFNFDKDFRVTRVTHFFGDSYRTVSEVTDDVMNSICRSAFNDLNVVLKAVRPEFQDRQASSYKTRDIDVTQAIMEKSY